MPGHSSAAIASYPFLGSSVQPTKVPERFGVGEDIFNPASPKTITFIQDVLKEVSDLFPGDIIHIGGMEKMILAMMWVAVSIFFQYHLKRTSKRKRWFY